MKFPDEYLINDRTLVICGFPGTGKSSYCYRDADYMPQGFATDSDSSSFDKSLFPSNYIEHIKSCIDKGYVRIFVSSHKIVRDALVEANIPFVLAFPNISLKDEYIKRYISRGDKQSFIDLISNNWNEWIKECSQQEKCFKLELQSGKYIANYM